MNILALDLGTKTGWAVGGLTLPTTSGVMDFKGSRFQGGGMRFLRFRTEIAKLIEGFSVEMVAFEEVRRHLGTDAAHVYGGFKAMLSAYCEEHKIAYQGYTPGQIKKHATGKGNAKKPAMISAAEARGFAPADDNEADAICLLALAVEDMAQDWCVREGR